MYEPKWDGFRCLIFRDEENIFLQSRTGKSLTSAFPEIVAAFRALSPKRFVLDGEQRFSPNLSVILLKWNAGHRIA
jgi:ATP-dependent DNA ligase